MFKHHKTVEHKLNTVIVDRHDWRIALFWSYHMTCLMGGFWQHCFKTAGKCGNKVVTDAARSKAYLSRFLFKLFLLTRTERVGSCVIHGPAVLLRRHRRNMLKTSVHMKIIEMLSNYKRLDVWLIKSLEYRWCLKIKQRCHFGSS